VHTVASWNEGRGPTSTLSLRGRREGKPATPHRPGIWLFQCESDPSNVGVQCVAGRAADVRRARGAAERDESDNKSEAKRDA